jgi:ligand-binding sensor domain-containing protein
MKKFILLFFLLDCCISWASAQPIEPELVKFDLLTSENQVLQKGLSQNTVKCLLQDRQGYMWFGTWDGLNKFDGYKFTIYNTQSGLSNETINALLEADDGKIWIGTENGLNCIDRRTGEISIFRHVADDSTSLSHNWINYLYQDEPGKILVCTPLGLNILDTKTGKVKLYQSQLAGAKDAPSNNIHFIARDRNKNYWIGTDFGAVRYNTINQENVRFLYRPDDPVSLSSNFVNCIYQDSDNKIWIGTDKGLNLFHPDKGTFTRFLYNAKDDSSISHNHITKIFEDNDGNFWVATDGGGVNILNRKSHSFTRIQTNINDPKSLSNDRVYDICQDDVDNLWFGTFNGVCRINKYVSNFELFVQGPNNPNSLRNNFVWAFLEVEPDLFWIGTADGISIYDKAKNKFSHFENMLSDGNSLSSNRIRYLAKDHTGNIWIGTFDAGLDCFVARSGEVINFSPSIQDNNSICDLNIQAIVEDSFGQLWVGTKNGLNVLDLETNHIKVFKHDPTNPGSISNNLVYGILEDSDKHIWLATLNGLCKYNRVENNFITFRDSTQPVQSQWTDKNFSIFEDTDKNLWIATRGNGLKKFDKKTETFTTYTTRDGLPNNVVYGIVEDNAGYLWMSTNWGISRFNISDETFLNFDVTDGLQSNEFNANAYLLSNSGEVFFGGMKGFNVFNPSKIKLNQSVPRIVITAFKIFNQVQPGEILDGDTILLTHNDNFFSFEFAALDYTKPSKNRYGYMLETYNKDWTFVPANRHFADYTKVIPGTYTFRVIGSNNNNIWNNQGVTITIVIRPPWYQTWYFRIGAILFLFFLIWLFIYFRVRRMRRKHKMEKKVLKIEKQLFDIQQKALRLQMNPHFIFNSLNSIQSYILNNDVDLAINYLARFSQLMRLILSNSRESIIPLADELQAIRLFLEIEKLRFEDKFTYSILVDPKIDDEFTGVPPMVIQPYIENAIIHGMVHKTSPGHITIRFQEKKSRMLCSIEDNGVGRAKAAEIKRKSGLNTKSRGMMITKERLEILNMKSDEKFSIKVIDLKDANGNPAGTRVELLITSQEL